MPHPCSSHAAPMPCRQGFRMCLSHLIYTMRPCLIHTYHAMAMPCSDHAVLFNATALHGRLSTAVLCCGLEKNGMVGARHGHDMASVNQIRPPCVNQIGKTHSKPLAARYGMGAAWARHAVCELALRVSVIFLNIPGGKNHEQNVGWNLGSEPQSISRLQCKLVALHCLETVLLCLVRELLHNEFSTAGAIQR